MRNAVLVRLFSRLHESTVNLLPYYLHRIVAQNFIPKNIRDAISQKTILNKFLPRLTETGINFDPIELMKLETLWLMPREELRLRADI
jgi:hypothetical protein